jgi:hypothetical protein
MHSLAKLRLRRQAMAAIRAAIDSELTLEAYQAKVGKLSAVLSPPVVGNLVWPLNH